MVCTRRSSRSKRRCIPAEADSCHSAAKHCNRKNSLTYTVPKEVSLLRRAGPYLIG